MEAASLSGVLSYTKLSGSSLCNSYDIFSRLIHRGRHIDSVSRHSSEGFNDADKPSSKALVALSSDLKSQNHNVIKGPRLSGGSSQKRNLNLRANCAVGDCTFGENVVKSHYADATEEKLGVLLLNLGGPEPLRCSTVSV